MHPLLSALAHGGTAAATMVAAETAGTKVWENIPDTAPTFVKTHALPLAFVGLGTLAVMKGRGYAQTAGIGLLAAGILHEISTFVGGAADVNFGA